MMADFREAPEPNYEYDVSLLVKTYEKALSDVQSELNSLALTDFQRAQIIATEKNIATILNDLTEYGEDWTKASLTAAAQQGIASTIFSLGLTATLEEAAQIVSFNTMNKRLVNAIIADTQADLLAVTSNVSRKTRAAVRQVTADVLRSKTAQGINGTQSLRQAITKDLRKQLGESADTAIVAANGTRWKLKPYVEMLVRTKMLEAHKEATINEALAEGSQYAVISSHGAKDACSSWEGRVIKLVRDAEGPYPFINDLPRNQIFHPNCKHVISPVSDLEFLPKRLRELNGIQEETQTEPTVNDNQPVVAKEINVSNSKALKSLTDDPSLARKLGEGGEDAVLKTLLDEQGFSGKASIVSKKELDGFIEGGELELFRGVTSVRHATDFRDNEVYAGLGAYGNGTYTAYGSGKADNGKRDGAGVTVAKEYSEGTGAIMRMSLRKDSKVVNYDQLVGEMMDYEDLIDAKISKATSKKAIDKLNSEKLLMRDYGRFATAKGYDAIDVPSQKYMVVLNRTSVRVQKQNFDLEGAKNEYNVK